MSTLSKCLALLALGSMTACSLPQPRAGDMAIHTLAPKVARSPESAASAQLLVDVPSAGAPIDSDRIAVRVGSGEYGVLRGQRWAESAPRLWQSLLVRALFDDGRRTAGRARENLSADEHLLGELRAFDYLRDQQRVHIHYVAQRVDGAGRVRDARSFESSAEVGAGSGDAEAKDVVAAFEQASSALLEELLDWLATPLADAPESAR